MHKGTNHSFRERLNMSKAFKDTLKLSFQKQVIVFEEVRTYQHEECVYLYVAYKCTKLIAATIDAHAGRIQ